MALSALSVGCALVYPYGDYARVDDAAAGGADTVGGSGGQPAGGGASAADAAEAGSDAANGGSAASGGQADDAGATGCVTPCTGLFSCIGAICIVSVTQQCSSACPEPYQVVGATLPQNKNCDPGCVSDSPGFVCARSGVVVIAQPDSNCPDGTHVAIADMTCAAKTTYVCISD